MDRPDVAILCVQGSSRQIVDAEHSVWALIILNVRFATYVDQSLILIVNGDGRVGADRTVGIVNVEDNGDRATRGGARDGLNTCLIQIESIPIDIEFTIRVVNRGIRRNQIHATIEIYVLDSIYNVIVNNAIIVQVGGQVSGQTDHCQV